MLHLSALRSAVLFDALLLSALMCPLVVTAQAPPRPPSAHAAGQSVSSTGRALPLVFEENLGQMPAGTAFTGRTQEYAVELRPHGLQFHLRGKDAQRTVAVDFIGTTGGQPAGVEQAGFRTNFYMGSDPKNWHTGVRNFDRVALRRLYPGIDAEFYARGGEIEHDFMVAPGADAAQLALRLSGAKAVSLTPEGDVLMTAEEGSLWLHRPMAYQVLADGKRQPVDVSFDLRADCSAAGSGGLRFRLGHYDHSRELVIDPVITYATYVSGSTSATGAALATDSAGNIYLTGNTQSPFPAFGAVGGSQDNVSGTTAPTKSATFVAQLAEAGGVQQIAWLTYYGSSKAAVTSSAIALQGGASVYIGGSTTATDLPTGTNSKFDTTATPGSTVGFVASFAQTDGSLEAGVYVEGTTASTTTSVAALAVSASQVIVAGQTNDGGVPVTKNVFDVSPNAISDATVIKGFVLVLDSALNASGFGTYVSGSTDVSGKTTTVTGVAADSNGNIYIGGSTNDSLLEAGSSPAAYFPVKTDGVSRDGFAAKIVPNPAALAYSVSTGGLTGAQDSGDDTVLGVALDSSDDLFVFGQTTSTNLLTYSSSPSTTIVSTGGAVTINPLDAVFPTGTTKAGYTFVVNAAGKLTGATYLAGGSGTTATVLAGAASTDGTAYYVAGNSSAAESAFPQATDKAATPVATLPAANISDLPSGQDKTGSTTSQRGYLLALKSDLSAANYRSYFGPSSGTSAAAGVAVDSTGNAYVLLNDNPTTVSDGSYTTASAPQTAPQAAIVSSYVAKVAPGAGPGGVIEKGTDSYSPNPLYYAKGTTVPLTLVWQVIGQGTGANQLVFDLPYNPNLLPYASGGDVSVTVGGAAQTGACSLGLSSSANAAPGITCVLAGPLTAGTVAEYTLAAKLNTNASPLPATFTVVADAYDTEGDSLSLIQTVSEIQVAALTLTDIVSAADPVSAGPPITVDAAVSLTSPGPQTAVTYTYTITNSTTVDSPGTTLQPNLPTAFSQTGVTIVPAGCNPTSTAGCDVPANGGKLIYTVTGVYLGSSFSNTLAEPFVESVISPSVTALHASPVASSSPTQTVNVVGYAVMAVTITPEVFTYPATNPTGYSLGDTASKLLVTLTNSGPNQAATATVTVTLPKGFVAKSSAVTTGTGAANCSTTPYTVCTLNTIDGVAPNSTAPNSASYTITGYYSDTGTTADAVDPPMTMATGGAASTVQSSVLVSGPSEAASVPAGGITVTGSYSPASAAYTKPIAVYRVNNLSYSIAASTATTAAAPLAINETNATHVNDSVTYKVQLQNTGTSIARGLYFTIPIAIPNPTSSVTPSSSVTLGTPSVTNPTGAFPGLSCSETTPSATVPLAFVCYSADLTSTPAPPTTNVAPGPAAATYTLTFTASYDETSIPATQANGKLAVPQSAGTFFAASESPAATAYNSNPASSINTPATIPVVMLQRSTQLSQALTVLRAAGQQVPAGFADKTDINLDEHVAGNLPGVNDTVTYLATTSNQGPNDALGVAVTIPIAKYMFVLSLPPECTGLAIGADSGPTGTTITCTPKTTITPASPVPPTAPTTYVSQVDAGGSYVVQFNAKYSDVLPTVNTVPGSKATGAATFGMATASDSDVHAGNGTTQSVSSVAPPAMSVQRAAHVSLMAFPVPQYSDGTGLGSDFTQNPAGQPEVGEAEPAMDLATRTAIPGSYVFNCLRYALTVVNSGPNYGAAGLNYNVGQSPFVAMQVAAGQPQAMPAINCGTAGINPSSGDLSYGSGSTTIYVDGYFGSTATGTSNSASVTFATTPFTAIDYSDSNQPADSTTAAHPDYSGAQTVSVVNTPFNSTGSGSSTPFGVTPYGLPAGSPSLSLILSQVTAPGVISSVLDNSLAGVLMPTGASPYPPDNKASLPLYTSGQKPQLYTIPTSAIIPARPDGSNTTNICLNMSAGLPDALVKPERALMWALGKVPENTNYPNPVPVFGSAASGNLTRDVTTIVMPPVGTNYTAVPATVTFPQAQQAQPAMVCGQINGLVSTNVTAQGASTGPPLKAGSTAISVLEPVNFPPYVVSGAPNAVSGQASKGSTAALAQAFLVQNGKVGNGTYDFNDSDPCYVNGQRTTCDDNPYLFAFAFSTEINNVLIPILGAPTKVPALTNTSLVSPTNFPLGTPINAGSDTQTYVLVADQVGGTSVGGFVTSTGTCTPQNCTESSPVQSSATGGYTFAESYVEDVPTANDKPAYGYGAGGVGQAAVTGVGSGSVSQSGLISIPVAVDCDPTKTTCPAVVSDSITPGQTAGFIWDKLGSSPGFDTSTSYTLSFQTFATPSNSDSATQAANTCYANMTCTLTVPNTTSNIYSAGGAAPTFFVSTNGTLYAKQSPSFWQRGAAFGALALLVPLFLRRRLSGRGAIGFVLLLGLICSPLLIGCGSSTSPSAGTSVTPTGTYYFRVTATPTTAGKSTITSAPFAVVVQSPN